MIGLDGQRVYLDWNATAPLRPEARAAMLRAMDAVGNPSSVHTEGRVARATVEKARVQVAALVGCEPGEVVFTSGATEAAAMALAGGYAVAWPCDHDSILAGADSDAARLGRDGRAQIPEFIPRSPEAGRPTGFQEFETAALSYASGETGVIQPVEEFIAFTGTVFPPFTSVCDISQALGRVRLGFWAERLSETGLDLAICSAHKIGGPKGIGALCELCGHRPRPLLRGGGQERGRRAGTENVIGIAGFGAAAEAARGDLEDGVWERVASLRDQLEARLESTAPDLIIVGRDAPRLPNTSCFALPGWPGETQVMQMDLAGFAVSAGSACSSGKVDRASRVLLAMGLDERTASSALRVSLGPTTSEAEVAAFADAWTDCYRRRNSRAA